MKKIIAHSIGHNRYVFYRSLKWLLIGLQLFILPIVSAGQPPIEWSTATHQPHFADFNGDGELDLLLQAIQPDHYNALIINQEQQSLAGDWLTAQLVTADFTGDGQADIFAYWPTEQWASLAGRRYTAADLAWLSLPQPLSLHSGDFNGDGFADLLVISEHKHYLMHSYFRDNGEVELQQIQIINPSVKWGQQHVAQLIIKDFNNDGRDDVFALAKQRDHSHYLSLSDSQGHFDKATKVPAHMADTDWDAERFSVQAANVNGDGHSELVRQPNAVGGIDERGIYSSEGSNVISENLFAADSGRVNRGKIATGHAVDCLYLTYTVTQELAGDTCTPTTPVTPSAYPNTYGSSYKPINRQYDIVLSAVTGANFYQLYESVSNNTLEPNNYTLVYSGSSLTSYHSTNAVGYRWYKYKACSSSTTCSGFSPWRRLYIYGVPGAPNNVNVAPLNVSVNQNFSITWGPASGSVDGTVYVVYETFNGTERSVYMVNRQHWSETQYQFTTAKAAGGSYQYRVQACNAYTGCGSSVVRYHTVTAPNDIPVVSPTSPVNGGSFTTNDDIIAAANASDSDGSIVRTEFRLDNGGWYIDSSAPYSVDLGRTTAGSHMVYYRSLDNSGAYSALQSLAISVAPRNEYIALTLTKDQTLKGELSVAWDPVSASSYYQLQRNILPLSTLYQQTKAVTMAELKQVEQNVLATTNADSWQDVVHANQLSYDEYGASEGIYYYRVRGCFSLNDCTPYSAELRVTMDKVEGLANWLSLSNNVTPGPMPITATVNENGDAVVNVPITIPPGVNHVQPDLTVQYSSGRISRLQDNPTYTGYEKINSGDYIGLGWRFAGLSQIHLCQMKDNASQVDVYFSNNYWCLDGERLIKTAESNSSHGTLYKTQLDQQIVIERFGVAGSYQTWFKVTLPNGTVREYGRSAQSQVPIKSERIYPSNKFAINKATDIWGNTINYRYSANADHNQLYPMEITYGNDGSGNADTKITFSYAYREDVEDIDELEYKYGSKLIMLTGIYTEQKNSEGSYHQVGKTLFYSEYPGAQRTAHRELAAIQHCGLDSGGGGETCYVPLQFDWIDLPSDNLPRYLSRVTDSLGATTDYTVATLYNDQTIGRFSERPFGEPSLPANTTYDTAVAKTPNLVTRMSKSDGLGGRVYLDYAYQGNAVRSTIQLGTLGFFAQRITDSSTGFVSYIKRRVDLPFIGQVAEFRTYSQLYKGANDELISKTENRYLAQMFTQANGTLTYFPYMKSTTQFNYEAGQLLSVNQKVNDHQFANNLISSTIQTTQIAGSATSGPLGNPWGERTTAILAQVQRTKRTTKTFTQRFNGGQWLVNFVSNQTTSNWHDIGVGLPDSIQTIDNTPFQNTNEIHTSTQFKGDENLAKTTTFNYNSAGLTISETVTGQHIASRTDRVSHNQDGRFAATLVNALGHNNRLVYDKRFGTVVKNTDPNNLITTIGLDNLGRVISNINSDGATTTTSYEFCQSVVCPTVYGVTPFFRMATTADTAPTQWQYFDSLNRTIRVATQGFNGTSTINQDTLFDEFGRPVRQSKPYSSDESTIPSTHFGYDNRNRIVSEDYPDGSRLTTTYHIAHGASADLLRVTTTRQVYSHSGVRLMDQVVSSDYNIATEMVSRTDAQSSVEAVTTTYRYRADGLPETVNIGGQGTVSFSYDNAGNRLTLTDPNIGVIRNTYNALNLPRTQTDNSGNVTVFSYDLLDRQVGQQYGNEGSSQWLFDTNPATNQTTYGALIRRTYTETGQNSPAFEQVNQYNGLSKLSQIDTTIRVANSTRQYQQGLTYDNQGRPLTSSWPTGITSKNRYNSANYLSGVVDNATEEVLQTINAKNALGQITSQSYGNGLTTVSEYNPLTSRVNRITTNQVQALNYQWRSNGLLENRQQGIDTYGNSQNLNEAMSYDGLNRLTQVIASNNGTMVRHQQTGYNALGNITYKISNVASDKQVDNYQYGDDLLTGQYSAGYNAIIAANVNGISTNVNYDQNGNIDYYSAIDASQQRFIQWNSRNLPMVITKGSAEDSTNPIAREQFKYGPDGQRFYKQSSYQDKNGVLQTEHTFYIGGIEEIVPAVESPYGLITKALLSDGVMSISTIDRNSNHKVSIEYLHKDYLGSIESITNQAGLRINNFAFDPYGERKTLDWTKNLTDDAISELITMNLYHYRGFTGHEHLDRTGLIHMNGRVYDPVFARFLSPDPLVSDPFFSQSYNRYSYVLNNPLGYTDPSGYSPSCTNDKFCNEVGIERLAGPGNYIIHFGALKKPAGKSDGDDSLGLLLATDGISDDKQGELNNSVVTEVGSIELAGFDAKVDISAPPSFIRLPAGVSYKDLSEAQKIAMHITNNTMLTVFQKAGKSTLAQAKEVQQKSITAVWYPNANVEGAWPELKNASAMGANITGENIQFNGEQMLRLLPGGRGIPGGVTMLEKGYHAVGFYGIKAGQAAFNYVVAHEIAHTTATNASFDHNVKRAESNADSFYLGIFER